MFMNLMRSAKSRRNIQRVNWLLAGDVVFLQGKNENQKRTHKQNKTKQKKSVARHAKTKPRARIECRKQFHACTFETSRICHVEIGAQGRDGVANS